ncbi:hypothetical protein ABFS82_11G043600 [Erythranthe guttata]
MFLLIKFWLHHCFAHTFFELLLHNFLTQLKKKSKIKT